MIKTLYVINKNSDKGYKVTSSNGAAVYVKVNSLEEVKSYIQTEEFFKAADRRFDLRDTVYLHVGFNYGKGIVCEKFKQKCDEQISKVQYPDSIVTMKKLIPTGHFEYISK